jgi:hypothetical protein
MVVGSAMVGEARDGRAKRWEPWEGEEMGLVPSVARCMHGSNAKDDFSHSLTYTLSEIILELFDFFGLRAT